MSAAVILLIIVASGEGQSPATQGLVAASSQAVGPGVSVQVHEASPPSDAEAARLEATLAPRAVAELLWLDANHTRARLRLHVARTDRWLERVIAFAAADSLPERGRTLGFALASMLPEADPALQVFAPAATNPAPSDDTARAPFLRRSVGLAAVGDVGVAGAATGLGGAAVVAYALTQSWALGLCAELWRGSIAAIAATDVTAHVGAGATWTPIAPTVARPWGLGFGLDALAVYEAVSHVHASGATEWKDKVLPGVDARVEGRWRLARGLELVLGAGPEIVLGTVDVAAVSSTVTKKATLPALRGRAQAGLRLDF